MLNPNEYTSIERVFQLLFLLHNPLDDGIDRAEIYAQIPDAITKVV